MGKNRNPILTLVFVIITLGIYALVWFYKTNKEMNAVSGRQWNVGLFTVFLVIPILNFWSAWKMADNIEAALKTKGTQPMMPKIGHFLLLALLSIVGIPLAQVDMNKLWGGTTATTTQTAAPA